MIDRPHVENILEISEGTLDVRQFFVERTPSTAARRGSSLWMTYLPS
jgi:hypothetical protein